MTGRVRYASEWATSGIGMAARRTMRSLLSVGVEVAWEPLDHLPGGPQRTIESGDAPMWMRARRRREIDDEVLVLHSVPFAWKLVTSQLRAEYRIGHSVWELDEVPLRFRRDMSEVDEIWVPTEWNRAAFERAFDKPVHVVPHAVVDVPPVDPPVLLPEDRAVVLLDGAWDWRKRPDRALEAYLHAFTRDDPVVLVIKTTETDRSWPGGPIRVRQLIDRIVARFPRPARVIVETSDYTEQQMLGLVSRASCSLSLTCSEGWGLGAFDAASLGVPVIITGFGGQVEYLGADYPGLLPFRMIPTNHEDTSLFEPGSAWAYADMDAAVDLLRSTIDGSAVDLLERARTLAPEINRRFATNMVGEQAAALLPPKATGETKRSASPIRVDRDPRPTVVILTPLQDVADRAQAYVDRVLSLDYPHELLSVAVLDSDSTDATAATFASEFARLHAVGIDAEVFERDVGQQMRAGVERGEHGLQLERRIVSAKTRNHLLARGLGDADWVLWLDVDVVEFPTDVIEQLLAVGGDVVQPNCVGRLSGRSCDDQAWTDQGRWHLDEYLGEGLVELHAVAGAMLLVRADCHRDGLVWPAYRYGVHNPRIRTGPSDARHPEIGEVESAGLAIMADDMGISCLGLPDLKVLHD